MKEVKGKGVGESAKNPRRRPVRSTPCAQTEKKKRKKPIKLNLGAGDIPIKGYISIDRKSGQEVYPLSYEDGSVKVIRASHVLEHFGHQQSYDICRHWVKKLKVGGVLKIAVPDFAKIAKYYTADYKRDAIGYVMGGQTDENDFHRSLFDLSSLAQLLAAVGLEDIKPWESEVQDCASLPISLNLQGTKKRDSEISPLVELEDKVIRAVMSMPRLAFTDNLFSAMRGVLPLNIQLSRGVGVFWGQVLTRMIEKHLDDGTDWILTLDYDTWFLKEHVFRLIQLMATNPQADAITTVQLQRNGCLPLVSRKSTTGKPQGEVPLGIFQMPLTEMSTGHFGLTLFRASAFKKLKKPWFWAKPAKDGTWNKGRQDEDIYFWHNFRRSGCKLFMANEVYIGHMQIVCSFAGKPEQNWEPIHVYMNDLEKDGPPAHCIPQITYCRIKKEK